MLAYNKRDRGKHGRSLRMRTLLLDSTFFPIRVVNWQKAMILLLTGRAELVDEYENQTIKSVTQNFNLPRILRLYNRHKSSHTVRFTRQNVFWRDAFRCQYCGGRFSGSDLTFDHVIPSSRGGGTNWVNIVSACHDCNTRKGNKTPEEANMPLLQKPRQPGWTPEVCLRLKDDDPDEWRFWLPQSKAASLF